MRTMQLPWPLPTRALGSLSEVPSVRLSHHPMETTADAVLDVKPRLTQGCWLAAGSPAWLRVARSHHEREEEGWTGPH